MGAAAQEGAVIAAVGAVFPAGSTADRYDPGIVTRLGVETPLGRTSSVRAEMEWSRSPGDPSSDSPYDLRVAGVALDIIWRWRRGAVAPILLLGGGGFQLQRIGDAESPYGVTPTVRAGLGIEWAITPQLFAFGEARGIAHLTDYAATEFSASLFRSLAIGARWQLP